MCCKCSKLSNLHEHFACKPQRVTALVCGPSLQCLLCLHFEPKVRLACIKAHARCTVEAESTHLNAGMIGVNLVTMKASPLLDLVSRCLTLSAPNTCRCCDCKYVCNPATRTHIGTSRAMQMHTRHHLACLIRSSSRLGNALHRCITQM